MKWFKHKVNHKTLNFHWSQQSNHAQSLFCNAMAFVPNQTSYGQFCTPHCYKFRQMVINASPEMKNSEEKKYYMFSWTVLYHKTKNPTDPKGPHLKEKFYLHLSTRHPTACYMPKILQEPWTYKSSRCLKNLCGKRTAMSFNAWTWAYEHAEYITINIVSLFRNDVKIFWNTHCMSYSIQNKIVYDTNRIIHRIRRKNFMNILIEHNMDFLHRYKLSID